MIESAQVGWGAAGAAFAAVVAALLKYRAEAKRVEKIDGPALMLEVMVGMRTEINELRETVSAQSERIDRLDRALRQSERERYDADRKNIILLAEKTALQSELTHALKRRSDVDAVTAAGLDVPPPSSSDLSKRATRPHE